MRKKRCVSPAPSVRSGRCAAILVEGYARLTDCLQAAGEQADAALIAAAQNRAGGMAHIIGDYAQAVAHFEAALALHRACGNQQGEGDILGSLGDVAANRGDFGAARHLLEQSLELSRKFGSADSETLALSRLGYIARERFRRSPGKTSRR